MIRTLKALLMAAMALAALGAVASAAQAEPLFHSNQPTTNLTVEADGTGKTGHQVFDAGANGSITCSVIHLTGTQSGTVASEVTLGGEYEGCTFVGLSAFVNLNGCAYTFHSTGTVDVGGANCATNPIKFGVVGLCEVEVGPQSGLHEITYHETVPPDPTKITAEAHVNGIHGVASGAGCPSPGTFTNGQYTTGNAIISGGGAEISVS